MQLFGKIIGFLCFLFLASNAYSISRVGPAEIGDVADGFTAQVPIQFGDIVPVSDTSLALYNIGIQIGVSPIHPTPFEDINIQSLRDVISGLVGKNIDDYIKAIEATGGTWTKQSISNTCMVLLTSVNGGARTTALSWGGGKGMWIQNPDSNTADSALIELILKIQLTDGACAW